MTITIDTKIAFIIISANLIIGNSILFLGAKSSFGENINYPLMMGMSIVCTVCYLLFFHFSNYQTYSTLKLIMVSILSCMAIIFFGNLLALFIKEPITEVLGNLFATVFMGIIGNIILLPISIALGLLNYGIITYLRSR